MASKPLAEYVGKVKSDSEKNLAARNERIERWKKAVNDLYEQIKGALEGQGQFHIQNLERYETDLGSYQIDMMTIDIGSIRLWLEPKARNVLGAHGRVDLKGPRGTVKLIRTEKNGEDEWSVPLDSSRPLDLTPLDDDALAQAFRHVIDGPNSTSGTSPSNRPARPRSR
jgi:hypothetical protein